MSNSTFDPQAFLDAQITEPSVKRPPLPAGSDFIGTIGEPIPGTWQSKKDSTKSGIKVDLPIVIDPSEHPSLDPAVYSTPIQLKLSVMLDTTPSGAIDNSPGKNGLMRRLREALDMNKPGQPFSWRAVEGRRIRVKIKHRDYEGEQYDDIDSIAKA
jgi:hypothetical protein